MKKKSYRSKVLRKERKLAAVIEHNRKYEEERNKYLNAITDKFVITDNNGAMGVATKVLPKVNSDFEAITQTNLCPQVP